MLIASLLSLRRAPCGSVSCHHWYVAVCVFALLEAVIAGQTGGVEAHAPAKELVESETLQAGSVYGAPSKSLRSNREARRPSHQIEVSSFNVRVSTLMTSLAPV